MSEPTPAIPELTFPDRLPTLRTPRLILREVGPGDAPAIRRYMGEFEVARQTGTIPHPYPPGAELEFLERVRKGWEERRVLAWAIEFADPGPFAPAGCEPVAGYIGSIGLHDVSGDHRRGELGYAIGKPFWGRGIAFEAASAILAFAFDSVRLNRVYATHYLDNAASGRVLAKCGFKPEGLHPSHVLRFGTFRDVVTMGILRKDWEQRR